MKEYYDIQDVIDAECTLEPVKCRNCGVIGEVTFDQIVHDGYCAICGYWQLSCEK